MTARLLAVSAALGAAVLLPAARASDDVTVSLCDGESTLTVPGLKPGVELPREEAKKVAADMMQVWRRNQGEERWAAWVREVEAVSAPAAAPAQAGPAAPAGQPTKFTARDQMLWKREEKKWIDEGYKAFHDAKALGGTIGISCDMCHPDGSNNHPETYPKFQVQLKKVALLRDMINWCIENPLKGKPLPEDDPNLRAVEAYLLSMRRGVALDPGKH
ncbi:MAG TPA: cytochrome C [Vicinamibacteria bacterium]|nr:cytochrome C [Vicinamibacteria bacterium]